MLALVKECVWKALINGMNWLCSLLIERRKNSWCGNSNNMESFTTRMLKKIDVNAIMCFKNVTVQHELTLKFVNGKEEQKLMWEW